MEIITRKEALEKGLPRYYTGKPCKRNNISHRNTKTKSCLCVACVDAKSTAQKQKRETIKQNRSPFHNSAQRVIARAKMYGIEVSYETAIDHLKSKHKALKSGETHFHSSVPCLKNHTGKKYVKSGSCYECEKIKSRLMARKHRSKRKEYMAVWRDNNKGVVRSNWQSWYETNKEQLRKRNKECPRKKAAAAEATMRRVAHKKNATPDWACLNKIETKYKERETMSRITGIVHHVDHIIPLQGENVCGLHVHNNLRVIPARDNLRKSNKLELR